MYDELDRLGVNINTYFASLLDRYENAGDISAITGPSALSSTDLDLLLDFSFYVARRHGERAAIDFCEKLHHYLLDTALKIHVGKVLVTQARLFNQIDKPMSRDLYAIEAAEAFLFFDQISAAEKALAMVRG